MFTRRDGALYLEGVRLSDLLTAGIPTPFYLYSLGQLRQNYRAYEDAVAGLPATVAFAIKSNHNPTLLSALREMGAGATVVSRHEVEHAIRLGFDPGKMLLHGNGKTRADLHAALSAGTLISADSEFDLVHIEEAARDQKTTAPVLLRVNPDIDPQVHPYISTGLLDSKFGMPGPVIDGLRLRGTLRTLRHVVVRGLHCHLGSTLRRVQPVADAMRVLLPLVERLRADGHPIDTVDLGGGLDIDYNRRGETLAGPVELVAAVRPDLLAARLRLWLEPGRSLSGNAGALIGRVIGVKHNGRRGFVIVDASMAQLIRPSLYNAYHHIELLEEAATGPPLRCDVVGPICESADFLGKDRDLPLPAEGDGVIVYDAGAYGFVMASRYNLNLLPAEYVVDGAAVRLSRRAETYEDFARTFVDREARSAAVIDREAPSAAVIKGRTGP